MPVLPGPCGLYRYKEFGTLEEGVMHQYFTLVNKQVDSIIFGNVQLAEDRIPSCLLVFRDESGSKTVDKSHKPRTGFVHDAIFYFEAENPLGQLVRQRRRWINGTFAAYLWVVREGWIWKGHHSWSVKLFATLLVFINLIQGVLIRMCGPSLFAVGLYSACLVLPLLLTNTPEQTLDMLYEFEPSKDVSQGIRSMAGLAAVAYLLIFAFFMIGHTPRAVPIKEGALKGRWRSDKRSAYRPWLFALGFLANALSLTLLVLMGAIIFVQVGWAATPLAFRLVVLFSVVPYGIALMDGLTNSQIPNATSLVTLLWATPCYLLASITFSIWLPAYTSARISDLSWGTRDNGEDDHQSKDVAKHRTKVGRRMTMTIVLSNVLATGTFIAFQSSVTGSLQVILLSCIGVLSIHFGVAGVDMLIRLFRKLRFVMILCPHDKIEKKKTKRARSGSSNSSTSIESEDISTDSSSSDDENEDLENARTIITTGHGSSRLNLAEVDIGVECVNIY
jgi:cellulose synthase/poly-beta-1,6-N-acetylglucosamine synthase-like glycosyltransferase